MSSAVLSVVARSFGSNRLIREVVALKMSNAFFGLSARAFKKPQEINTHKMSANAYKDNTNNYLTCLLLANFRFYQGDYEIELPCGHILHQVVNLIIIHS